MPDLTSIARKAATLDAQIKLETEELKKLKAKLIAGGEADYGCAKVIFPAPSLKPDEAAVAEVKRLVGAKLFGKLFVETVVLQPVKAFREIAAVLCPPAVLVDVITACEKPSSPQVRFS